MATFREITYMVLDLLKERSDDSYYTEEHIIFLAGKFRAYLLERKYAKSRNKAYQSVSSENTQRICVDLERASLLPAGCGGNWLTSVQEIPDMVNADEAKVSTVSDMIFSNLTMIPAERMPYVGYNKWLKNIVYAAISGDNHLYLTSNNSQFQFLKKVVIDGVFSDPAKAAEMSCNPDGSDVACDVLDQAFPLEEALIPSCIELIVEELAGPRYAPEDRANNAKDDLSEVGVARSRSNAPVERSENRNRSGATEAPVAEEQK